jgi:hypothetical protein
MLVEAHRRMAALSEQIAGGVSLPEGDDAAQTRLLSHTRELTGAMEDFLAANTAKPAYTTLVQNGQHAPHATAYTPRYVSRGGSSERLETSALEIDLVAAAKRCRDRRHELSLLLVEPHVYDISSEPDAAAAHRDAQTALENACAGFDRNGLNLVPLSHQRTAAIVSNCDRRAAVDLAQQAISALARVAPPGFDTVSGMATTLSIGIATASVIPKNFDPARMIDSAARCLAAASACGISTVKSIEV